MRSRFNSKELVLTLLEVDPSGKSAVDVATLTLDLGQLVDTEASTKTMAVVPLPGVPSASPRLAVCTPPRTASHTLHAPQPAAWCLI